jgi:hypothetical protein
VPLLGVPTAGQRERKTHRRHVPRLASARVGAPVPAIADGPERGRSVPAVARYRAPGSCRSRVGLLRRTAKRRGPKVPFAAFTYPFDSAVCKGIEDLENLLEHASLISSCD